MLVSYISGGPIPQNLAQTFDGPPTLERSGPEHRVGRFPPSLLRFLSPRRGTEGVVKTIEEGLGEKVELSLQERRRDRKTFTKKGDIIMDTIAINSNIYKGAESYAKMHNMSVTAAIEKAILLFLQKVQPKQKPMETAEFKDALSYVKTLKATGGRPIPADENSLEALVDTKYAL